MQSTLRIGTRGSPLALAQAHLVERAIAAHWDGPVEVVPMTTTGDRIQDRALIDAGGKGLFTKEIEEALLSGAADVAVHSMKDMPTELPPGLAIDAILPREDPRDVWLSPVANSIEELPEGARVGTASMRRQAQVLALRPDLEVVVLRGNVNTRLAKLERGEADATLLALAGLKRLGLETSATTILPLDVMLPAPAQGAIGLEVRADNEKVRTAVSALNHLPSAQAIAAERAFLRVLDGSCRTPIAALATLDGGDTFTLRGKVLSPDGKTIYETRRSGALRDAVSVGEAAGLEIRKDAGEAFFAALAAAQNNA